MSAKSKKAAGRRKVDTLQAGASLSEAAALLALAAPVAKAPAASVKAKLLARVRASQAEAVTAPGWRFDAVGSDAGWRGGRVPGVRFKTLSVDEARDVVLLLIEMGPGARFPDHVHEAGGDEGLVLSGDVFTGGRWLRAGDYYYAAEGTTHNDIVSPTGCTALVRLTERAWRNWKRHLATP